MSLFSRLWPVTGPGVPKGQLARTGLPLLGATFLSEVWALIGLNWLVLFASLPLVTLPAAHVAAMQVCGRLLDEAPHETARDFWRAFRAALLASMLWLIPLAALVAAAGWTVFIYAQLAAQHPAYAAPGAVAGCVTLGLAMLALNLAAEIADRPGPGLLVRAVRHTLAHPAPALGATLAIAALWLGAILVFPVSAILAVIVLFSLGPLIAAFAMRPGELSRRAKLRRANLEETL